MDENKNIFLINGIYLESLISSLKTVSEALELEVKEIYEALDDMSEGWSGDSYDLFVDMMDKYKDPLNAVSLSIQAFSEILESDVKPALSDAQDEIIGAMGSSGGGGGDIGLHGVHSNVVVAVR